MFVIMPLPIKQQPGKKRKNSNPPRNAQYIP